MPRREKFGFSLKNFLCGVALSPSPHPHAEPGAEEVVDRPIGTESAQAGDRPDGRSGLGKERERLLQADVEYLVEDAVSRRLAEPQLEEAAGTREAGGERGGGQAVAGFLADDFLGFEDELLVAAVAARRFAAGDEERRDEDGRRRRGEPRRLVR